MSARDEILARIRAARGRGDAPTAKESAAAIDYMRAHAQGPRPRLAWEPVSRFRERTLQLDGTVAQIAGLDAVPSAVAEYLDAHTLPRRAVCWPEFAGLEWQAAGLTVEARPAGASDAVGITGAFCAIAETGTLMLLSAPQMPPETGLLPETHIAILHAVRIVCGMEDAWSLLRDEVGAMPRAVSLISGPSRTADIEQTLVLGAHGPCRLHVVVVV